jgi:hypothetical protein
MAKTRTRRGGFLGQLINQGIVPLSILGMQQTYHRKKQGGKITRKTNRRKRSHRRR